MLPDFVATETLPTMRRRNPGTAAALALAFATVLALPATARADTCGWTSPFDDVAQGDSFCSNVQWLLNRGITLGCATDLYCPTQAVTRAQMALFMNRLGTVLTPVADTTFQVNGGAVDIDDPSDHCVSDPWVVQDYSRNMLIHAHFSGRMNAAGAYGIGIRYNNTGSATDFPFGPVGAAQYVGTDAAHWTHASTSWVVPITPGTWRFAIRIIRSGTSNVGDLSTFQCTLTQLLMNRNGTGVGQDELLLDRP